MAIIFNEYDLVNHDDRLVEDQVYQESVIAGILIGGGIIAAVATIIAIVSKHLKKSAAGNPEKKNDDSSAEGLSIDKPDEVRKRLEEVKAKLEAIGGTVTIPDGFIDFKEFNARFEKYIEFAKQARNVLESEGDQIIKKIDDLDQMISSMSADNKYIQSGPNNQVNNAYLDQIIECSAKVQDVIKTYEEVSNELSNREKSSKEQADKETDNDKRTQANDINAKIKKLSADAKKIGINANDDMSKLRALINNIINTVNSKSNTQTKDNKQQNPANPNNPPANNGNGNGNNNEPNEIRQRIDDFMDNNKRNTSGKYTMSRDEVSALVMKMYNFALGDNQEGIKDAVTEYIESNDDVDKLNVFKNLLSHMDTNKTIQMNGIQLNLISKFGDMIDNKIKSLSDKVEYIVQKTQKEKTQFENDVSKYINKDYTTFVQEILNALDHTNEDIAKQTFIDLTNKYMYDAISQGNVFSIDTQTNKDGSTTIIYTAKDNFVDHFVGCCHSIFNVMKSNPNLYENVIEIDFNSIDNSYIKRDPKNSKNWICKIDGGTIPAPPPPPTPTPPNPEVTKIIDYLIKNANGNKQPFSKLTREEMITLVDDALKLINDDNKLEDYFDEIINNNGNDGVRLKEIYTIFRRSTKLFKNNRIFNDKLNKIQSELTRIGGLHIIARANIHDTDIYNKATSVFQTPEQYNEARQTIGHPNNIIEEIISEIDQKDFDAVADILIDKYKKYMGECIKNGVFKYDPIGKTITIDNNKKASFDMINAIFNGIATDCGEFNGAKMTDKLARVSSLFTTNKVTKDLYDECLTLAGHDTNLSPEDQMLSNIDYATFKADARGKKYSVRMSEQEWYALAKDIFNASLNSHDANDFNTYIIDRANAKLSDKNYLQTLRDLTIIISKDKNFPANIIPQSEIDNIEQKINGMVQSQLSANTQASQITNTFISNGMNTFNGYRDTNQTCTMNQKTIQNTVYEIIQSITQDVAQLGTYVANTCKTLKNSAKRSDHGKLIIFKRLISETLNTIGTDKKVINAMVDIIINEIPDNLKDIISETTAAVNNNPQYRQTIPQLEQLLSTKYVDICKSVINDCESNNIGNIIQTYKAYLGVFMNANYFDQDASGYYNYNLMYKSMFELLKNSLYTTVECFNNVNINTIDPTEFKNAFGDGFTGPYSADQYNEFIQLAGNKYGHKQINKAFTIEKFIEDDLSSGKLDLLLGAGLYSTGEVRFDNPNASEVSDLLSLQQDYDINRFFKINFNNYDALNTSGFITEFTRISNLARYITLMGLYDENSGIIPLSREGILPILKFYPITGDEISKIDIRTDINTYRAKKTALKNAIQGKIDNVISNCERAGVFKGRIFNNNADKNKEAHRKKMENFVTNALDAMDKVKEYYDYIMNKGNNP